MLNTLRGEPNTELKPHSFRFGRLFENFVVNENIRLRDHLQKDWKFFYWRTSTGKEVDLLLAPNPTYPQWAIEIKSDDSPDHNSVQNLLAIRKEYPDIRLICLSRAPRPYEVSGVPVLPWKQALQLLAKS